MDEQVIVERVCKRLNLELMTMGDSTTEFINFTAVDGDERKSYSVARNKQNGLRNILAKRPFGKWLLVAELR